MTHLTKRRWRLGTLLGATLIVVSPAVPLPASTSAVAPLSVPAVATQVGLPLGPAGLVEDRTTTTLQPGVTLTTIVRGAVDPSQFWTVEVLIPAGSSSPDPDAPPAALSDRAGADVLADRTRTAGFDPRVEQVITRPRPTTPAAAWAGGCGSATSGAGPRPTPSGPSWSLRASAARPSSPAGTGWPPPAVRGGSGC